MKRYVLSDESDAELLDQFVDERSEAAFAALVERHGRMVRGVCRRVLDDRTSADDAYQAAFLVLASKAAALRRRLGPGKSLGAWLNRVAHNAAIQVWRSETARSRRERIVGMRSADSPPCRDAAEEVLPILDEEMQTLPEKYRAPLVLHYLEEKSQQAAADELGLTLGTLRRRLDRGKELLRRRLVRRGVAVSAFLLGELLRDAGASAASCPHSFGGVIAAQSVADRSGAGLRSVPGLSAPALSAGQALMRNMGLRTLARSLGILVAPALFLLVTAAVVSKEEPPRPPSADVVPRSLVEAHREKAIPRGPGDAPETKEPEPPPSAAPARAVPDPGSLARQADQPTAAARPADTARNAALAAGPGPLGPAPADPAPPVEKFSAEININGKVTRFDNEADFEKARRQLNGEGGFTPLVPGPGIAGLPSGDYSSGTSQSLPDGLGGIGFGGTFVSVTVRKPGSISCTRKDGCCRPGSGSSRPAASRSDSDPADSNNTPRP